MVAWQGAPNKTQQAEGDARFWYARGAFKGFLDRLWGRALAPIRNTEAVERDVRRQGESTERLYLFIKNEAELAGLKEAGRGLEDAVRLPGESVPVRPDRRGARHRRAHGRHARQVHADERR